MNASKQKSWGPLRVVGVALIFAIAASAVYVGWRYWLFTGGVFRTSSFNEQKWKSLNRRTKDFSCYRGGMAADIQANVLHVGQSRAEVENLLGSPETSERAYYQYFLGMCSRFQIDFDTLDVHFDEGGKLKRVSIVQH